MCACVNDEIKINENQVGTVYTILLQLIDIIIGWNGLV